MASYRPIALTSDVSNLAERLILARLSFDAEQRQLILSQQVGFRTGQSEEDGIGRLVQQVQDGWMEPAEGAPQGPGESTNAQKNVLLTYDFSQAFHTVDHRLRRLPTARTGHSTLLSQVDLAVPVRDRRARAEMNGTLSGCLGPAETYEPPRPTTSPRSRSVPRGAGQTARQQEVSGAAGGLHREAGRQGAELCIPAGRLCSSFRAEIS